MSSNCQLEASKSISDSIVDTYSSLYANSTMYLLAILVIEGVNHNVNKSIVYGLSMQRNKFFVLKIVFQLNYILLKDLCVRYWIVIEMYLSNVHYF